MLLKFVWLLRKSFKVTSQAMISTWYSCNCIVQMIKNLWLDQITSRNSFKIL